MEQTIAILLVEDSPSDALLLREALAEVSDFPHRLDEAQTLNRGIELAEQQEYDVVLLDLGLPDSQGVDTYLSFHRRIPDMPALVLTALDDVRLGLVAIQKGAQDYLVKRDIGPGLLAKAVRYAIERHRISSALSRSEERFQLAVLGAAAGLWEWNPRSNKLYFAPRFNEILGYRADEKLNEIGTYRHATHPDDRQQVQEKLDAHLTQGAPFDVEYRVKHKDGHYVWVEASGQAQWDETGEPYRMVGWILDISVRKQVEEALKQSHWKLKLLASRLQTVIEEERTRISREVHDQLGQDMSAVKMDLTWIRGRLASSGADEAKLEPLRARLSETEALLDRTMEVMQRIALELRPSSLDYLGLVPAIRGETRRYTARTGIPVIIENSRPLPPLAPEVATAFFRILQELLTNVARHAKATGVWVSLREQDGHVVLTVEDNGTGMVPGAQDRMTSLGILGMRERAADVGGTLQLESQAGRGTQAIVSIPYEPLSRVANG